MAVVGQHLEQLAFAQAVLDPAPPVGGQDLAVRLEEHLLQVRVEAEEVA